MWGRRNAIKQADAFAADAVPVELWVTRLRYP
jgi:hypothetical protein